MSIFNSAPKIESEEVQTVVNELNTTLTNFYSSLEEKCRGKSDGPAFVKRTRLELDTMLKNKYIPEIRNILNNKHNDPSDSNASDFKKSLIQQIKDDLQIHIDTENFGADSLM